LKRKIPLTEKSNINIQMFPEHLGLWHAPFRVSLLGMITQ